MSEYDYMHKWRDWASEEGLSSWRIENVQLSMPDLFFVYDQVTFWQEMKVRKGNLVYLRKYQWPNSLRLATALGDYRMNINVYNPLNQTFELYTIPEIKRLGPRASDADGKKGILKVSLLMGKPWFTVQNRVDFKKYKEVLYRKSISLDYIDMTPMQN